MGINKTVYILFSLLILLLAGSIVYNLFFLDKVEPVRLGYDQDGKPATAPFNPLEVPPMGTDKGGGNIALRLLEGFQYTFLIIAGVTICRMLFGGIMAYLLVFPFRKVSYLIQRAFIPYQFVPAFIMVIILTGSVRFLQNTISTLDIIVFQFCILAFIGLPIVANTLTNELKQVMKTEYVAAARTLGSSNLRIFWRHLMPVIKPRLLVIFLQQMSSTLILLMHLGIFEYYIGGARAETVGDEDDPWPRFLSMSGEWAGMIGDSRRDIIAAPWIFFGPLCASVLLLIVINLIIRNLEGNKNSMKKRPNLNKGQGSTGKDSWTEKTRERSGIK